MSCGPSAKSTALNKELHADQITVTLSNSVLGNQQQIDFLALEEALQQLFNLDARKAQIVELRHFCGMTTAEFARQLKISSKTAEADCYLTRAWLLKQLAREDSDG